MQVFITKSEVTEKVKSKLAPEETTDIGKTVNKQQYGLTAGAEIMFRINGYNLLCDLRYSYSFTAVYQSDSDRITKLREKYFPNQSKENPEINFTHLTLMLGFMF